MKIYQLIIFSAVFSFSLMNCSIEPLQPEKPLLPLDSAPLQKPVFTIVDSEPHPTTGKSNARGTVFWAGKGIKNVKVLLCDGTMDFVGSIVLRPLGENPSLCQGKAFKSKTDSNGNYLFRDLAPGIYSIAVRTPDSKRNYLVLTEKSSLVSFPTCSKIQLEANQTTEIQTQNVWKTDLKLTSPKLKQVLLERLPVLSWQIYPDAKSYKVSLKSGGKEILIVNKSETVCVPTSELSDGEYDWEITAFGENNEVIAKNSSSFHIGIVKKTKTTSNGIGMGIGK